MNSRRDRIKLLLGIAWQMLTLAVFAVLALAGIVGGVAAIAATLMT